MRYIFCGSRDLKESWDIWNTLRSLNPAEDIIIHGDYRGADKIAGYYAHRMGFIVEPFPADWDTHGRRAGPIRNRKMLDAGADAVYAFSNKPLAQSSGTSDMVRIAREAGVPVFVTERF